MAQRSRRPRSKRELEDLEAKGLWNAIALANKIGESNERITLVHILTIHRTMLAAAFPEVAGRFRRAGEDIKKLKCIEPPPGRVVEEQIYSFWLEFDKKLALQPRHPRRQTMNQRKQWYDRVIELAAWTHHQIAAIHPFAEGNGRLARLMTNVVLRRCGLPPASVNYEADKNAYRSALCQIDRYGDYEPLKRLIVDDIRRAYQREGELRRRKLSTGR